MVTPGTVVWYIWVKIVVKDLAEMVKVLCLLPDLRRHLLGDYIPRYYTHFHLVPVELLQDSWLIVAQRASLGQHWLADTQELHDF